MRLLVPDNFTGQVIDASGKIHNPQKGIVAIPVKEVTENLWGLGFAAAEVLPPKQTKPNNSIT